MVFLSSFLALFVAFIVAFVLILLSLFRWIIGLLRRDKSDSGARNERVVIVGIDGCDPRITEKLMAQDKLPNLSALADVGTYCPLRTTCPPLSPVAWSTFATGTNPGKHNIHDFLRRDPRTYQESLSSTRMWGDKQSVNLGRYSMPIRQPTVELMQKSKPFWEVLGESGIFSAVIRVPITYPAKKFRGVSLSGMCVPDLLGTQGTFFYYTTDSQEIANYESGLAFALDGKNGKFHADIQGPENPLLAGSCPMTIPMTLRIDTNGEGAELHVQGNTIKLQVGRHSSWVQITFKASLLYRVSGICQFYLVATEPEVRLYQSPINVDPANPSMPIASPLIFSNYLTKAHGTFATLGLAEDTWAVNENILSEDAFAEQCYSFHHERRKIFFDMLSKVHHGAFVFVFDIADRVQHIFLGSPDQGSQHSRDIPNRVERVYRDMDELIGEVRQQLDDDTVLFVVSDHGFGRFGRCVDLNRWLQEEGYLFPDEESSSEEHWSQRIDWTRTKAYAVGLSGLYLNLKGREGQGIVEPEQQAEALKEEIAEGLCAAKDAATGQWPIRRVFDSAKVYNGPYTSNAPDLIVGYRRGYRVSWESAVGNMADKVFFDNAKAWAADHAMDPAEVPGVLFCNRRIEAEEIWIGDLAPTVLGLFGIDPPSYIDGQQLELYRDIKRE